MPRKANFLLEWSPFEMLSNHLKAFATSEDFRFYLQVGAVEVICVYDKCPKILYTKVSVKMAYANSADLDQTAPEGAV